MPKLDAHDAESESPYQQIEVYLQMAEDEIASAARLANSYEDLDTDDSQLLEEPHSIHPLDRGFQSNSSFHSHSSSDSIDERCLPKSLQKLYRSAKHSVHANGRKTPLGCRERRLSYRKSLRNEATKYDGRVGSILQDAKLQKWSQDVLKDFQALVQEEIKCLSLDPKSRRGYVKSDSLKYQKHPDSREEKAPCAESRPGGESFNTRMGSTQSNLRFTEVWPAEYSHYRTYTLPRSTQRSFSLSSQTYESADADVTDEPCRLIKLIQHRHSRSLSLDEGKELSPWALRNLMLIDEAHGSSDRCSDTDKCTLLSEETKNQMVEEPCENCAETTVADAAETTSSQSITTNSKPFSRLNNSHSDGELNCIKKTGIVNALTIDDLKFDNGESLIWADQDDSVLSATGNGISKSELEKSIQPFHAREEIQQNLSDKENITVPSHRKSNPDISTWSVTPHRQVIDALQLTRYNDPNPDKQVSENRLQLPEMPVFNSQSWEVLPPADEMEVMENKPIPEEVAEPGILIPARLSRSRSLNSSLSSLSQLSVPDDFSECDVESTVFDNEFCTGDFSPDVYVNPAEICSLVSKSNTDFHRAVEVGIKPRSKSWEIEQCSVVEKQEEPVSSPDDDADTDNVLRANSENPSTITGILHLTPMSSSSSNNQIILSVSIPKNCNVQTSEGGQQTGSEFTPDKMPYSIAEEYILRPKYSRPSKEDRVKCSPNKKRHSGGEASIKARSHKNNDHSANKKRFLNSSYSSSETLPDTNDFLKEVQTRIPPSPPKNMDVLPCKNTLFLPTESNAFSVLHNASTQTSPLPSPTCCSPSYSFTWLGDCKCDNYSLEPCVSSVGLSTPDDDLDNLHYTKAVWSDDGSASSSPPQTPASPLREDSPMSLSASLDYLEQNIESGIGTVSTRPSTSPPTNFGSLDFSGSNLSSEDTGLEAGFEKRQRRYQPNSRAHRSSSHSLQYRKKRHRLRLTDQWSGREHQMTQTDVNLLTPDSETCSTYNRNLRASSEEARTSLYSRKGDKSVRQTISEPRLSARSNNIYIKGGSSESSLPPLPSPKSVPTPMLPTVLENGRKPLARPTNLPLAPHTYSSFKASSAPSVEVRMRKRYIRSNSSLSPTGSFSGRLPGRTHSSKQLSELEAVEACKWLRAAGFPQYAQMYEDFQFPLDLLSVERDHSFLDRDSIHALFRRLKILNRCARIRIDSAKKSKIADSDEDQECALSGNWEFQANSRRWSRVDPHQMTITDRQDDQKANDYERKRCTSESPDDLSIGQFKRSGSERLRDGAKAILRRMESLKSKKKRKHRDGIIISSPTILDDLNMQARMEELGCVDISPDTSPQIHSREGLFTKKKKHLKDTKNSIGGEDSSSMASDHSQSSTPIARSRRRRKIWGDRRRFGENSGAYSDSECSPPAWRHDFNHSVNNVRPLSSNREVIIFPQKLPNARRRPELRHATSLTYGKESQRVRENFLSSLRVKPKTQRETLPVSSPTNARHSIYDNVPLVICNKNYYDYHNDGRDVEMSAQEGSASSECTLESRESPFPSTQEDEDTDDRPSRRNTLDRWHSFNKKSPPYTTFRQYSTHINGFSVGQMNHLRKRALLRLTALMERYCPVNRTAWNWELPKFMRKMKNPDYKDRLIFGVPLQIINQRTGQPLHPVILRAFNYIRANCLDQLGIFRKPGVKTRIQRLRELHELGEELDYDSYCPCDIADMIKTYFRELPEVLLTNKLSEIFITICQYLPEDTRVEALQCAMLMMPDENRETLMALLSFLSDVAEESHLNQMTANNLAVCMAPSLFHMNIGSTGSSPLRKRATGAPEQKDLHDNKAAHQCLALMIVQVTKLMSIPIEMLSNCRFSYLDNSQPVSLEDLGTNYSSGLTVKAGDWSSYMTACISSLLKETRDKNRGWIHVNNSDSMLDISYRKVGDGHPLRLLRVTTEVEAPPSELITRIVRERHLWDESLVKWRVVNKLSKQAEVFQYMCSSMPQRPTMDFCVLRCWKTDIGNRVCVFVETSIEHAECPTLDGCVRGIVLASRYLIQPCGSGKSRITHLSRIDMRGRLPEWYNKIYPFIAALRLAKLRESFRHSATGPESNV